MTGLAKFRLFSFRLYTLDRNQAADLLIRQDLWLDMSTRYALGTKDQMAGATIGHYKKMNATTTRRESVHARGG